ncbi:MAG: shikimate kinase [Planctomycetota bacterium]|nr:shikimate kinase [Planctomycetota bacterium]
MSRPVVLLGLRCAGKSAVGRELAKELDLPFVDLDLELAALEGSGRSVGELLEELGEERFRDLEVAALSASLSRGALVLAAGGGVIEREENRSLLGEGAKLIWLDAPDEELLRRRGADETSRPLLAGADPAEELSLIGPRRRALYEALVGRVHETMGKDISALASDLAKGLRGAAGIDG